MAATDVNLIAVIVAAAVSMGIGFIWYSPMLFRNAWLKEIGIPKKTIENKKKSMCLQFGLMFIAVIVMSYVLAHFAAYAGATDLMGGLVLGLWTWLGFAAPLTFASYLFEGKSLKFYLINVFHHLAVLLVMGAILAVWN